MPSSPALRQLCGNRSGDDDQYSHKMAGRRAASAARPPRYKEQGRIGAIGASSHYAQTALRMVNSGLIDVLMYPVNLFRHGDDHNAALYQACAEQGVGLVAMEALRWRRDLCTSAIGLADSVHLLCALAAGCHGSDRCQERRGTCWGVGLLDGQG